MRYVISLNSADLKISVSSIGAMLLTGGKWAYCGNSMSDNSKDGLNGHSKVRSRKFNSMIAHYKDSSRQK